MKPNIKIAIIDDNQVYRFIARKLFQKATPLAHLIELYDGQHAIDFLISKRNFPAELPELIFMDINMPNLNGWQFLDELRKINIASYAPAIYIVSSSKALEDTRIAATYPEIKGYLVKPLHMPEIQALIPESK